MVAASKPNIIMIMADDVGIWNISAYHRGMMGGSTPTLDADMALTHRSLFPWARQGVLDYEVVRKEAQTPECNISSYREKRRNRDQAIHQST